MERIILKNAQIVNEGVSFYGDISLKDGKIEKIASKINLQGKEIDCTGKIVMPGIIDDQVHFREPGLTQKANIATESRAAVAGGVTSFMEMPNTNPTATTQVLLQDKYDIASRVSPANYSFFMGATNDNIEEVLKTDKHDVCGIKIFMGSSTGNMLVDNAVTLEGIFSRTDLLIATHCEDEQTIRNNMADAIKEYGDDIPFSMHPIIRNEEACYLSSSLAKRLAEKHGARLHILHISTAEEVELFAPGPIKDKLVTSEVCVHHMYFDASMYEEKGSLIKCNPAIKAPHHKEALMKALLNDQLDIIATDHAPHTWDEKMGNYVQAPSGLPLVQHSLNIMLEFVQEGKLSIEKVVEKMCHAPAECFHLRNRGYLREGYAADIVVVNPNEKWTVSKDNILYKCAWSPLENHEFQGRVEQTYVNGQLVYQEGRVTEVLAGERLQFH